jgi:hypothetical protein
VPQLSNSLSTSFVLPRDNELDHKKEAEEPTVDGTHHRFSNHLRRKRDDR